MNPCPLWKELQKPYYLAPMRKPQHKKSGNCPGHTASRCWGRTSGPPVPCAIMAARAVPLTLTREGGVGWGGALTQRTDSER